MTKKVIAQKARPFKGNPVWKVTVFDACKLQLPRAFMLMRDVKAEAKFFVRKARELGSTVTVDEVLEAVNNG